jgi:hypothetical protein
MKQLPEIKVEIERLAKLIDANEDQLPTYGVSEQSGRPHIEVDDLGYHYVNAERGHEFKRLTTWELDQLLYAVFQAVTFRLAINFELRHRIEGKDCRRLAFQKQIELLSVFPHKWDECRSNEISEILKDHPFDDNRSARATFWGQLRKQGCSPEEIWKIAGEKYPPPEGWTLEPMGGLKRESENHSEATNSATV